jgi:hypothetical protein
MAWCLVKHRNNSTFTLVHMISVFVLYGVGIWCQA